MTQYLLPTDVKVYVDSGNGDIQFDEDVVAKS